MTSYDWISDAVDGGVSDMTAQNVFDSRYKDYVISLSTDDSDIRRASIEKDLEEDARELSEIDGVPRPPKLNITSSTFTDLVWDSTALGEPMYTSWASPTPTTVIIPAGTRFVQDPVTGEFTNVDDIVVEI